MTPLFRSASTEPFDRLYQQHAASVYRYARAVLGNHADAEDVAQQTFLNAYRSLAQGTKPRKAENWLMTIAHNEVRRHLRDTRAQRQEVELDTELADRPQERPEPGVHDVLRALQHLTPNQRSALVMREFEGRSYAEISGIMGISQSALETLMFRARRSLADALEDGLTCAEAELAVSRRLDGRLSRREARRLKKHVRECQVCRAFALRQKRQRSLLGGLSVIPVPASLLPFRGEQAAAAVGGGAAASAVAVGGSAGIAAKAAAVVAAVTVAGGVGYTAGGDHLPAVRQHRAAAPAQPEVAPVPVTHRTAVVPTPRRVVRAPLSPKARVVHVPKSKRVRTRSVEKPDKVEPRALAKETRKANNVAARPERSRPAAELKAKPQHPTPPRSRPAHEPKPKEAKARPAEPERPVKPEPKVKPPPAPPVVPQGLEKKLLEPKPEKTKEP